MAVAITLNGDVTTHRIDRNPHRLPGGVDRVNRRLVAQYLQRMEEFADESRLPVEHLAIQSAALTANVREITAATTKLETLLRNLNAMDYYGEDRLWTHLEALVDLIRVRLGEVERRVK